MPICDINDKVKFGNVNKCRTYTSRISADGEVIPLYDTYETGIVNRQSLNPNITWISRLMTPKDRSAPVDHCSLQTNDNEQILIERVSNIDGGLWGPPLWEYLHMMSLKYSNSPSYNEKRTMKNLLNNISHFLPCDKCRNHAVEYMNNNDLDIATTNTDTLFRFLVDFHNSVNKRLGKPIMGVNTAYTIYLSKINNNN